ncbi:hypothetical protein AVEN_195439-1 [Araneus ventricosus]|uniref:Tetraspanin n=1 Tax=Araneus ventricosus TaxID=182803 RepID=A0A4Y2I3B8_ARAVE|nr:hypothetical protein AVEN_195439-1 [Araneus ventricosus]
MLLSWYVKTTLDKKIHFLQEYYHPKAVPLSFLVSGLVMILVSFLGIKAAVGGRVVEDASDAKSAAFFFHMYWTAATITVFAILAAAFACFVEIYFLRHGLGQGLKAGMEKYGQSSEIKSEIDRLQMDYKCCGVHSYKTWYNISWIDVQYLDARHPGVAR